MDADSVLRCVRAWQGNPGGYTARQLRTWGRNYDAVNELVEESTGKPQLTDYMTRLRTYLDVNMVRACVFEHPYSNEMLVAVRTSGITLLALLVPSAINIVIDRTLSVSECAVSVAVVQVQTEPTCIVHGDVGLHNVIIHPTENKVNALIDWEIATLGHPMVDVNYFARGNFAPNSDEEWGFVETYFAARTAQLPLISKQEWRFFGLMVSNPDVCRRRPAAL